MIQSLELGGFPIVLKNQAVSSVTVLALHGAWGAARSFDWFSLEAERRNIRVIAPDMNYGPRTLARDLKKLESFLQVTGNVVHIVAHSAAAPVALALAVGATTSYVRSITLVSPVPPSGIPIERMVLGLLGVYASRMQDLGDNLVELSREDAELLFMECIPESERDLFYSNLVPVPASLLSDLAALSIAGGSIRINQRDRDRLGRVPRRLVRGGKDPICTWPVARDILKIFGTDEAEDRCIQRAGHALLVEPAKESATELILDFIRSVR